jgi:hypothetical protein
MSTESNDGLAIDLNGVASLFETNVGSCF